MQSAPVTGNPVYSPVMLVGQAPGDKEPVRGRPFAWTAGKTLFQWFQDACGMEEQTFRQRVYMALEAHIGHCMRCRYAGHEFDLISLPHPSGASPWPRQEPGKSLLRKALQLIAAHPSMMALATLPGTQDQP